MSDASETPSKRKPFARYIEGLKTGKMPEDVLEEAKRRPRLRPRPVVVGQRPRPHVPTVEEIRRRTHKALQPGVEPAAQPTEPVSRDSGVDGGMDSGMDGGMNGGADAPAVKRKVFERYVAGVKSAQEGSVALPAGALPGSSPSGARYQLSTRTRLTGVLAMLAFVIGAILYLDSSARRMVRDEEAAANAEPTVVVEPDPSGASLPEPPATLLGPIWIDAYQYTDPADERPPEADKDAVLEYGDFLTVVPKGRGKKWIYYALMGTDARMRLTRYFSPEVITRQLPPLKITLREKEAGKIQVMVIASRTELPKIAEWVQAASYLEVPEGGEARILRFGELAQLLQQNLKAGEVAFRLLPALEYRPTPLPVLTPNP